MPDILDDQDLWWALAEEEEQRWDDGHSALGVLRAHARRELEEVERERVAEHLVHCADCRQSLLSLAVPTAAAARGRRGDGNRPPWAFWLGSPRLAWSLAGGLALVCSMLLLRPPTAVEGPGVPEQIQLLELQQVTDDVLLGTEPEVGVDGSQPVILLLVTYRVTLEGPQDLAIFNATGELYHVVAIPRAGFPGQLTAVLPGDALRPGVNMITLTTKSEERIRFQVTLAPQE